MALHGKKLSHIIGTKYRNDSEKMRELILYAEEAEELLICMRYILDSNVSIVGTRNSFYIDITKLLEYKKPL